MAKYIASQEFLNRAYERYTELYFKRRSYVGRTSKEYTDAITGKSYKGSMQGFLTRQEFKLVYQAMRGKGFHDVTQEIVGRQSYQFTKKQATAMRENLIERGDWDEATAPSINDIRMFGKTYVGDFNKIVGGTLGETISSYVFGS